MFSLQIKEGIKTVKMKREKGVWLLKTSIQSNPVGFNMLYVLNIFFFLYTEHYVSHLFLLTLKIYIQDTLMKYILSLLFMANEETTRI